MSDTEKVEYTRQKQGRGKTVRYATVERMAKVNQENLKVYEQYIKSNVVKNKDVAKTTYKVYRSYFNIFLCFIMEHRDNFYILDEDILEDDMVEVMEEFIGFLQDELGNNKKTINTKLSAVSSFYGWAVKRRKIKTHPFDGRLDRMQNAQEEKIISEYFLNQEEVDTIVDALSHVGEPTCDKDMIDKMLWHIAFDSACRVGALHGLKVSNLELDKRRFVNVREKRGKIVSIPFSPATADIIREHLEQRKVLGIDCDELFYTRRGDGWAGMSTQGISSRVRKFGHIIGIADFRPHCIRKTRLNMVFKKNAVLAQQLANHSDMSTTQKHYTEKEDQSDVFKKIEELDSI